MTDDEIRALLEAATPGPWKVFIDDTGGRWTGWPLSVDCPSIVDKTVVRTGGMWPYEWDAKTSQDEACTNARLIAAAPDAFAEVLRLREALRDTTASLVAAVSLLERGGKKAAPSDKMFAVMLDDYRASIERARAALKGAAQ